MSRVPSVPLSDEDKQKIAAIQVKAMIQREKDLKNQPFTGPTRVKGRDYRTLTMVVRDWTAYIALHGIAVVGVFFLYFFLIALNTAVIYFVQSNFAVLSVLAPSLVTAFLLWRTRRVPKNRKESRLWGEIETFRRGGHFNDVAQHLHTLAEAGSLKAMLQLSELLDAGRGAARNPKRAFDLVRQAAKRGHVAAQFALGERYLNGFGTTVDIREAMQWFKSAADHGLPAAAMSLGYLYEHPRRYHEPDLEAAAEWYKQAAERYLMMKQPEDAKAAIAALKNVKHDDTVLGRLQAHIASMESSTGIAQKMRASI